MSVAKWTDTYRIHHWRILWSRYRKFAWLGFEPTNHWILFIHSNLPSYQAMNSTHTQIHIYVYVYVYLSIFRKQLLVKLLYMQSLKRNKDKYVNWLSCMIFKCVKINQLQWGKTFIKVSNNVLTRKKVSDFKFANCVHLEVAFISLFCMYIKSLCFDNFMKWLIVCWNIFSINIFFA